MDVEIREDLIPPSCKGCEGVEVVAGVHKGVSVYWVQHGTQSAPTVAQTGAEAQRVLGDLHNRQQPEAEAEAEEPIAFVHPETADALGLTSTEADPQPQIEGAPA